MRNDTFYFSFPSPYIVSANKNNLYDRSSKRKMSFRIHSSLQCFLQYAHSLRDLVDPLMWPGVHIHSFVQMQSICHSRHQPQIDTTQTCSNVMVTVTTFKLTSGKCVYLCSGGSKVAPVLAGNHYLIVHETYSVCSTPFHFDKLCTVLNLEHRR